MAADPRRAWWRWPSRGSPGLTTPRRLADAGYQAVLVGETLVRGRGPGGRGGRRWPGHPVGHRRPRGARVSADEAGGEADGASFVKICGITSEADALLAVGLGADAVGFIFAPSPRQVAAKHGRPTSSSACPRRS